MVLEDGSSMSGHAADQDLQQVPFQTGHSDALPFGMMGAAANVTASHASELADGQAQSYERFTDTRSSSGNAMPRRGVFQVDDVITPDTKKQDFTATGDFQRSAFLPFFHPAKAAAAFDAAVEKLGSVLTPSLPLQRRAADVCTQDLRGWPDIRGLPQEQGQDQGCSNTAALEWDTAAIFDAPADFRGFGGGADVSQAGTVALPQQLHTAHPRQLKQFEQQLASRHADLRRPGGRGGGDEGGRKQLSGDSPVTVGPQVPVKLFINRVPKWMTNEQLKKVFDPFGEVLECNILKDPQGSKGCAFVKYANITDAHQAILHLHSRKVLGNSGGYPIQIKYADGEIERLGLSPDVQPGGESVKVFVGCLPVTCAETELFEVFSRFGRVDEVHILRGPDSKPKCSAFVTFPKMSMAISAIKELDKQLVLANGKRPIEVRLAESKRTRTKQKRSQLHGDEALSADHDVYAASTTEVSPDSAVAPGVFDGGGLSMSNHIQGAPANGVAPQLHQTSIGKTRAVTELHLLELRESFESSEVSRLNAVSLPACGEEFSGPVGAGAAFPARGSARVTGRDNAAEPLQRSSTAFTPQAAILGCKVLRDVGGQAYFLPPYAEFLMRLPRQPPPPPPPEQQQPPPREVNRRRNRRQQQQVQTKQHLTQGHGRSTRLSGGASPQSSFNFPLLQQPDARLLAGSIEGTAYEAAAYSYPYLPVGLGGYAEDYFNTALSRVSYIGSPPNSLGGPYLGVATDHAASSFVPFHDLTRGQHEAFAASPQQQQQQQQQHDSQPRMGSLQASVTALAPPFAGILRGGGVNGVRRYYARFPETGKSTYSARLTATAATTAAYRDQMAHPNEDPQYYYSRSMHTAV